MDTLRAAVVQMPHGETLEDNLRRARDLLGEARDRGARLVLLPEYFFVGAGDGPGAAARHADAVRALLERASSEMGMAVAGNVLERRDGALRNLGVAYEDGRLVLEQPKVHPMPREAGDGIQGGDALLAGDVLGHRTGVLVCSDVLYPEAARVLALQGAEILLNPVMSPYREGDETKEAREALFIARAYDAAAFVLKAGGFRRPAAQGEPQVGVPGGVAGRSLVAAPWGILARYRDDFTQEVLVADLDFARLRRFREKQAAFPARRPEAYGGLL